MHQIPLASRITPIDRLGAAVEVSISSGGPNGSASECAVFHDRRPVPSSADGLLVEMMSVAPFEIYASATIGREPVVLSAFEAAMANDHVDFGRVLSWAREDACVILDMLVDHITRFPNANSLLFAALASVRRAARDAIRVVSLALSSDQTHLTIGMAVELCIEFKTLSVLIPRSTRDGVHARFSTNNDARVIGALSRDLLPVHHSIFVRKQIPFHQVCFEQHVLPQTYDELYATRTGDLQLVLDRSKDDACRRAASTSAFGFALLERMYMNEGKIMPCKLSMLHHGHDHALVYFLEHTSARCDDNARPRKPTEPAGVVRVCFDVDADWCRCDIRAAMCVNHD